MKHLVAALAALAGFAVVYLLAGFVAWDWDASQWDVGGRFYVALVGATVAIAAFGIAASGDWE